MNRPVLTTFGILPSPNNPMAVARRLMEDGYTYEGLPTLRYWRKQWFAWEDNHWAVTAEDSVRGVLQNWLEHAKYMHTPNPTRAEPNPAAVEKAWLPNPRSVNAVLDSLRTGVTLLSDRIEAPCWYPASAEPGGEGANPAGQILACRDTLLHVPTRAVLHSTPALFNLYAADIDYCPAAPAPTEFLAFLDSIWPADDDKDAISLLQEWFGYVISGETDMQKILAMTGPRRSGKGTILRVLGDLLGGAGNVGSATLTALSESFGLESLIGKPLIVIPDARHATEKASHVATEHLLMISGDDQVSANRKNLGRWNGRMPGRIMIMTNQIPEFDDASGAMPSRIVHLAMTESFLDREDHGLRHRIHAELPGILNWALDGYQRLRNRKDDEGNPVAAYFTTPKSSADAKQMMDDLAQPVRRFLDECVVRTGDTIALQVRKVDLFAAWQNWAQTNNLGAQNYSDEQFARDVKAVWPTLKTTQAHGGKERARSWLGLRVLRQAQRQGYQWPQQDPYTGANTGETHANDSSN